MKTVALTGLRQMEVQTLPDPVLRTPRDVLVKVSHVGVCGSDLHYYETGRIGEQVVDYPFIVGHECSGVVIEVGSEVSRVCPGDSVAVDPAVSCHRCDQCRGGRENTCRHLEFLGCPGQIPGCLAEYLVMPEASLYPTWGRISLEQAALCEPLSIGLYAVRQSRIQAGDRIGILGAGPIGHCVMQAARLEGAGKILITDVLDDRVQRALEGGADWGGNPRQADVVRGIHDENPGGLDVVFECAGEQETLDQAVEMLKPGGRLMLVGIPRTDRVSFCIDLMRRKEITLINVRRQNRCVEPAIEAVSVESVDVDSLVTHRFRLEETAAAFELVAGYHDQVLKAVIEMA